MRKAFTLIELLIVVAIIAILAAIAVPNFLEAQVRAKVSRAKSDMRTLATALETYSVDHNKYPPCNNNITPGRRPAAGTNGPIPATEKPILERLSTPIAYATSGFLPDPFKPEIRTESHSAGNPQGTKESIYGPGVGIGTVGGYNPHHLIKYGAMDPNANQTAGFADGNPVGEIPKAWMLISAGPDGNYPAMGQIMLRTMPDIVPSSQFYDPTNGTVSYGDIWRVNSASLAKSTDAWGGKFMSMAATASR